MPERRLQKALVCLLVLGLALVGCGGNPAPPPPTAQYTCGQLAHDFRRPGDAPADRGQAVTDAIVSRVKGGGQPSANVRDVVVYALASACSHRSASWRPVAGAIRTVQRIFRTG